MLRGGGAYESTHRDGRARDIDCRARASGRCSRGARGVFPFARRRNPAHCLCKRTAAGAGGYDDEPRRQRPARSFGRSDFVGIRHRYRRLSQDEAERALVSVESSDPLTPQDVYVHGHTVRPPKWQGLAENRKGETTRDDRRCVPAADCSRRSCPGLESSHKNHADRVRLISRPRYSINRTITVVLRVHRGRDNAKSH